MVGRSWAAPKWPGRTLPTRRAGIAGQRSVSFVSSSPVFAGAKSTWARGNPGTKHSPLSPRRSQRKRLKLAFCGITVSTAHSGASPKSSPCYASANWAIVCTIVVDKGWNVPQTTLPRVGRTPLSAAFDVDLPSPCLDPQCRRPMSNLS